MKPTFNDVFEDFYENEANKFQDCRSQAKRQFKELWGTDELDDDIKR